MRNQTPLAPDEPDFDVTAHVVLNDFGYLGRAYVETDEMEADEAAVVENILKGELRIRCGWLPSIPPKAGRVMSPRICYESFKRLDGAYANTERLSLSTTPSLTDHSPF